MICPSCGKQNPPEYAYCNRCGAALAPLRAPAKKKTGKKTLAALIAVWALVFLAVLVLIAWRFLTQTKDTGPEAHSADRYEFVLGDYSREQAEQYARERGGYLAQFDSREEFDEVTAELTKAGKRSYFWIGAGRAQDEREYFWDDTRDVPLNDPDNWCFDLWPEDEPSFGEDVCVVLCYDETKKQWIMIDVPELPMDGDDTAKPYGILLEFA